MDRKTQELVLAKVTEINKQKCLQQCPEFLESDNCEEKQLFIFLLERYMKDFHKDECAQEQYDFLEDAISYSGFNESKSSKYMSLCNAVFKAITEEFIFLKTKDLGEEGNIAFFRNFTHVKSKYKTNHYGNPYFSATLEIENFFSENVIGFKPSCDFKNYTRVGDFEGLSRLIELYKIDNQIYKAFIEDYIKGVLFEHLRTGWNYDFELIIDVKEC